MLGSRRRKKKGAAHSDTRARAVSKSSRMPHVGQPLSQREIIQLQSTLGNHTVRRLLNDGTLQRQGDGLPPERLDEFKAINQTRRDYEALAMVAATEGATQADLIEAISIGSMLLAQLTMWFERGPSTVEIDTALLGLAATVQDFVESLRDEIIAEEESMKFYEEALQKLNAEYGLESTGTEAVMEDTITAQIDSKPAPSPPQAEQQNAPTSSPPSADDSEKVAQLKTQIDDISAMIQQNMAGLLEESGMLAPLKAKMEDLEAAGGLFKRSNRPSTEAAQQAQMDAYEKRKAALHKERLARKASIKMAREAARNAT